MEELAGQSCINPPPPFFFKMAYKQNLDLRYVLISDPGTFQKHVSIRPRLWPIMNNQITVGS